jgi:hypothetical protein
LSFFFLLSSLPWFHYHHQLFSGSYKGIAVHLFSHIIVNVISKIYFFSFMYLIYDSDKKSFYLAKNNW